MQADGAALDVIGFGATGYAADVLEKSLRADVNIVETVAHMMSARHFVGRTVTSCVTSVARTSRSCSCRTATSKTSG